MQIINTSELRQFSNKHPKARRPLDNWEKIVSQAIWKNFIELRATFRCADYVQGFVVFDIGGNNYRLIALVDYNAQQVRILDLMIHSAYDRWKP